MDGNDLVNAVAGAIAGALILAGGVGVLIGLGIWGIYELIT
jgi:hypothetical protein